MSGTSPLSRRPLSILPTPLGVVMLVAAQVGAFSVHTANNPTVAGMVWAFAAAIIAIGVLWPIVSGLRIGVGIESAPRDSVVGDEVEVDIVLRGPRSDVAVRWIITGDEEWRAASVPGVGSLPTTGLRRGAHDSLVLEVRTHAPIGLLAVRRTFVVALEHPLIVGPRPADISWTPRRASAADAEHRQSRSTTRGDVVRSVRPYVPGDPPNHVHWPTSARTGALVVREFEPPAELGEAVVVDLDVPAGEEAIEAAVARAAGLVRSVLEHGGRVVLCTCESGVATAGVVTRTLDASRRLAVAGAGRPGSAPPGWSSVVVSP